MVFVAIGILGGIGLIIAGFSDPERISLAGVGFAVLIAGLWAGAFARALSAMVELLLELLIKQG